jgi:hypothetical protein
MAIQLAVSMEGESYSDKGKTDPVQSPCPEFSIAPRAKEAFERGGDQR